MVGEIISKRNMKYYLVKQDTNFGYDCEFLKLTEIAPFLDFEYKNLIGYDYYMDGDRGNFNIFSSKFTFLTVKE